MSLLNALLPLEADEQISSVKYLPTELVPELYEHKNSIVDVLCEDVKGRKFCVKMQMEWSNAFKQRVLFNASKLYVTQAATGEEYADLKPVYSLNLVNAIFEREMPNTFIHNYKIVHDKDSKKVITGLHFTFIELPKFTPHTMLEKHMAELWLRYLTEINANTDQVPAELRENPEINKALEELKVTAFTEAELRAYDKALDSIRVERTLLNDRYQKGIEEGEIRKSIAIAQNLLTIGLPIAQIKRATGLTQEQIERLRN